MSEAFDSPKFYTKFKATMDGAPMRMYVYLTVDTDRWKDLDLKQAKYAPMQQAYEKFAEENSARFTEFLQQVYGIYLQCEKIPKLRLVQENSTDI